MPTSLQNATTRLLDGAAGQNREIADQPVGQLTGDRHLAIPLELLDRRLRVGADDASWLELAVAKLGQRALDGGNAARRDDQISNRIIFSRARPLADAARQTMPPASPVRVPRACRQRALRLRPGEPAAMVRTPASARRLRC